MVKTLQRKREIKSPINPFFSAITNTATALLTIVVAIAAIGQWLFPQQSQSPSQTPSPSQLQPSSPHPRPSLSKGQIGVLIYALFCLIIGGSVYAYSYNRFRPDDSFTHIVEGKQIIIPSFVANQWGASETKKADGSCYPHPETDSYNLVAWPQVIGSAKTQPGGIYACFPTLNLSIAGNMALRVDMQIHNGEEAGIEFKVFSSDLSNKLDNFYLYSINSNGTYQLSKDVANQSTQGPPNTALPSDRVTIARGANFKNTLALTMIEHTICLYANLGANHQTPLRCIADDHPYGTGTIGLFVGKYPGDVTFSALTVWGL